jgi:hypothetical protein
MTRTRADGPVPIGITRVLLKLVLLVPPLVLAWLDWDRGAQ